MHQAAKATSDTPGGQMLHGHDNANKTSAPAYSWGYAERKGMDAGAPDSPGPAMYKMEEHHDQKHSSHHARNYQGWEEGKMPGMIHTRERWEKEDKIFSPSYLKGEEAKPKGQGGPIGLSHGDAGRDGNAFTFSGADRFNISGDTPG